MVCTPTVMNPAYRSSCLKDKGHDSLNMLDHIGAWADMYQKFRNEEIPEKEYLDWKSQFPAK